jgi:hypothetical protein
MRVSTATPALWSLGLLLSASASAAPMPPPKYWSPARCEQAFRSHPLVRQVRCVPSGGPETCRWRSDRRVRLYSEFTVFTRNHQRYVSGAGQVVPGVVRSFTLATRARPGFTRIVHRYGDQYADWPADFFTAHGRMLATHVTPAHFPSLVAPIAADLMRGETMSCTGT